MKKILLVLLCCNFFNLVQAQNKDWLVQAGQDPSFARQYGFGRAFKTQNYMIGVGVANESKQTLDMYNGKKWKQLLVDSSLGNSYSILSLDERNDSIVLIGTQKIDKHGDLILLYNGTNWAPIKKLDSMEGNHLVYKGLGFQDVKFYHHKLYGIFLNTDFKSTLIEYDFNSNSIKSLATFQQDMSDSLAFMVQTLKMNLYIQNDRLYLAGYYDSVNHVSSQGFGYYDGTTFVNKPLFTNHDGRNMSLVRRLDDTFSVLLRLSLNINLHGKYGKMYLMRDDSIIEEISANLFADYRTNTAISMRGWNLDYQVMWLNGKITYMDVESWNYNALEYDDIQNEWNPVDIAVTHPFAFCFKKEQYLFSSTLIYPYATSMHGGCFKVRQSLPLSGYAFMDIDSNCVRSQADSVMKREWITLKGDSAYLSFLTRDDGSYEIPVIFGKYWFESNKSNLTTTLCNTDTIVIDSLIPYKKDIPYSFVPPYNTQGDIVVSIGRTYIERGRACFVSIFLENKGKNALSVIPTLKFSKKLQFISSSATVSSQGSDKITFSGQNVTFYDPVRIVVKFFAHQDSFQVHDTTLFEGFADSSNSEVDYANNHIRHTETVMAPFDPNSITGNPENTTLSSPAEIQYTVHFQNLGNGIAHNVKVVDTIPEALDISSIRILDHSGADLEASISKRVLEFLFTDIELSPSSVSDSGSQGYVSFAIRLKEPMRIGQSISNRVGIFFDYEDVVPTNTTSVMLVKQGSSISRVTKGNTPFMVYPNPGSTHLLIKTGEDGVISNVKFYTVAGQEIYANRTGDADFDISGWTTGLYLISVEIHGKYYNSLYNKIE